MVIPERLQDNRANQLAICHRNNVLGLHLSSGNDLMVLFGITVPISISE